MQNSLDKLPNITQQDTDHRKGGERREIRRKELVGAEGFEPTTPASQTLCATRLRYAPTHR